MKAYKARDLADASRSRTTAGQLAQRPPGHRRQQLVQVERRRHCCCRTPRVCEAAQTQSRDERAAPARLLSLLGRVGIVTLLSGGIKTVKMDGCGRIQTCGHRFSPAVSAFWHKIGLTNKRIFTRYPKVFIFLITESR